MKPSSVKYWVCSEKYVKITEEGLINHYNSNLLIAYARSGRYKLIRKDFKGARMDYKHAIFYHGYGQYLWRIRAILGYVFSLFKTNVEGLSRILGKETYNH